MSCSDLIYSARYSYRRPSVGVTGFVLSLITGAALVRLIYSAIVKPPVGNEWLAALFVLPIVGIMFSCGVFLLTAYFRELYLELLLTRSGVKYGKKFFPWSKVRWIGSVFSGGRYQLVVGRRGFSSDLHLMIDDGLSEDDYLRLIDKLRAELEPYYAEIEIG